MGPTTGTCKKLFAGSSSYLWVRVLAIVIKKIHSRFVHFVYFVVKKSVNTEADDTDILSLEKEPPIDTDKNG